MSATRTLRIVIEYDGTDFAGWQRQAGQRTVQACLEEALGTMTGGPVSVRGAGRTDAGVHAAGQVASVRLASKIPTIGFLRGLNSALPTDMAIIDVADMDASFDARRSARGKIYRYLIWNHSVRSPLHARTAWYIRQTLDTHAMRTAATCFVGEHDFAAFRAADCERLSTRRVMQRFEVSRHGPLVTCEVEGTAFLKNMVRIMVGTLVSAGRGEADAESIRRLIDSRDRTQAGVTAPAHGLTLVRVLY